MSGWQPIETAPRDETQPVILWNGEEVVPGIAYEGGWSDFWYDWVSPQPTHWQPLPEPPVTP